MTHTPSTARPLFTGPRSHESLVLDAERLQARIYADTETLRAVAVALAEQYPADDRGVWLCRIVNRLTVALSTERGGV